MTRPLLLALALTACGTQSLMAQTRIVRYGDDRLAGIREVDVVVGVDGDAPPQCRVSREALQTSAVQALRSRQIRATVSEKASSWHYTVFVTVHTAVVASECASAVSIELIAQVEGFPEADKYAAADAWGSILIGSMTLAREIDLVTAGAREHDAMVQTAARTHVAGLADRIRHANQ